MRCSASKFDDAASARGRDLMMRTAGARIMSISGARRAQTSPGLPADAHDAGFRAGRGPPELGEALKAKPLRDARQRRRPSSVASRGSR